MDLDRGELRTPGGVHRLTPVELRLLRYLLDRPGEVIPQKELLTEVWGYADAVESRAAYHAFARLRRRIEVDPRRPRYLVAVRGRGFRLDRGETVQELRPATLPGLPRPRTPLFGRQDELEGLLEWLRDEYTPLVTVCGMGGIGKTRLAVEAVRRLAPVRARVHWCDVGTASDLEAALSMVARQVELATGPDLEARLTRGLSRLGEALLVLDNTEHLVDDGLARCVGEWLDQAPQLDVLNVGRRPLDLAGEALVRLDVLPVPGPDTPEDRLTAIPSVQLLVDRIVRRNPGFRVRGPIAALARSVVRHLEGWPLGIEIVAAQWAPGIEGEVDRWLSEVSTLRRSARDVPDRHRTLNASLSWSWSALDGEHRRWLQTAVCLRAGVWVDRLSGLGDPRAAIGALHERGWLRAVEAPSLVEADGGVRYVLLEPVRSWLQDRHPPSEGIWTSVLDWLAERCRQTPTARLGELAEEFATLEHALGRAMARSDAESIAAIAFAIGVVGHKFGPQQVALRLVESALAAVPDRAELWHRAGLLASTTRSDEEGIGHLERASALADAGTLRWTIQMHLASVAFRTGDADRANRLCAQVVAEAPSGSGVELAALANWCGILAAQRDPRAVELGERAWALAQRRRAFTFAPALLSNLAEAYLAADRPAEARRAATDGLRLAKEGDVQRAMLTCVVAISWIEADPELAERSLEEVAEAAPSHADVRAIGLARAWLAVLRARAGELAQAQRLAEQASRIGGPSVEGVLERLPRGVWPLTASRRSRC